MEIKNIKSLLFAKSSSSDLQEAQLNSGFLIFISMCHHSNINNNVNFILNIKYIKTHTIINNIYLIY